MNAADYTTYDDGDPIYPTLTVKDDNDEPVDPVSLDAWVKFGDDGIAADYSSQIVRVAQGSYRVNFIDSTGYGGNWIFVQWLTTSPQSSERWFCYVRERVA